MSDETKADGLEPTTAIQVQNEDGSAHIVGLDNLRVHLFQSGAFWIAQALEIDYAAQGASLEEAKANFEEGLSATLDENIRAFGTIESVLKAAPPEIWGRAYAAPNLEIYRQVSAHQAPPAPIHKLAPWFSRIDYLTSLAAA